MQKAETLLITSGKKLQSDTLDLGETIQSVAQNFRTQSCIYLIHIGPSCRLGDNIFILHKGPEKRERKNSPDHPGVNRFSLMLGIILKFHYCKIFYTKLCFSYMLGKRLNSIWKKTEKGALFFYKWHACLTLNWSNFSTCYVCVFLL